MNVKGYCVKCRARCDIANAKHITTKNGRPAAKGDCPTCGTSVMRFLPLK